MATTADHLKHLGSVRLFSECSDSDLQQLNQLAIETTVPAGQTLMTQGHTSRDAYLILEGTAVVERDGMQISTAGPGACIGELAVIAPGVRSATVRAETDLVVLAMGSTQFLEAIERVAPLARSIMRSLAQRLHDELAAENALI